MKPDFDNEILYYARREARGGRSGFAAAADFLIIAAFCSFGLWLAVRPRFANRAACALIVVCCLAAGIAIYIALARGKREKALYRIIKEGEADAALTKVLLDPEPVFRAVREAGGAVLIEKTETFTTDDLREALGGRSPRGLTAVSPASPTEHALELMRNLGMKYASPKEFLGDDYGALCPVSKYEARGAALVKYREKYKKTRRPIKLSLTGERAVKYVSVGVGLLLMSLFMRYSLYYRLAGSLAISLGTAVFAAERLKPAVSS